MSPLPLVIVLFGLLATLLLWTVIRAGGGWPLKLALIVVTPLLAAALWASLGSYKGWPTGAAPPAAALLLYGVVDEPDPAHGSAGAIYVWLQPLERAGGLGYRPAAGEPRAYRIPYSRELREGVSRGLRLARKGSVVMQRLQAPRGRRESRRASSYRFYRFRPSLPLKDAR